jgi:hypothetical protein
MGRLILFAFSALALRAGSIAGLVTDPAGATIPAARVVATDWNGERTDVKTDREGRFVIADLKPGSYSIEISFPGFHNKKIENVQVRADEETGVPAITLAVAVIGGCVGPFPPVDVYTPIAAGRSQLSGHVIR